MLRLDLDQLLLQSFDEGLHVRAGSLDRRGLEQQGDHQQQDHRAKAAGNRVQEGQVQAVGCLAAPSLSHGQSCDGVRKEPRVRMASSPEADRRLRVPLHGQQDHVDRHPRRQFTHGLAQEVGTLVGSTGVSTAGRLLALGGQAVGQQEDIVRHGLQLPCRPEKALIEARALFRHHLAQARHGLLQRAGAPASSQLPSLPGHRAVAPASLKT